MDIISNNNSTASTIGISTGSSTTWSMDYNLSESTSEIDYEKIFKEFEKRYNKKPTFEHRCNNCGAVLKMDLNNHIFKCPYCRSVYAIGTNRIEDRI